MTVKDEWQNIKGRSWNHLVIFTAVWSLSSIRRSIIGNFCVGMLCNKRTASVMLQNIPGAYNLW